ncbi:hypothetical protein Pfo_031333 [Paulownia fortunei]|nr:hypothetical protein Pfo_031333 [Paulownia fortunei]
MSKSHRGGIVSSIVVVAIVAALGTAYATRDQSASGTSITAVGSTALQPLVEAAGEEYAKENLGTFINVQGGGTGTGLSQVSQDAVDLGKITNWQEVGGKNLDIVIINRATGSGTRATFEKWALDGAESISAQEQDSSGMVRSIVATTPGAISYAAFGYIDSSVVAASVNGIKPNNQNVATGKYAIWSYEHVYTKGKPNAQVNGVNVKDFLFGTTWNPSVTDPATKKPYIGALPMILGSFLVTFLAAIVATPFAIGTALFMTEIAQKRGAKIMQPIVELLVGIPSVVYGFIGLTVVVPVIRTIAGGSGFGILSGTIVLFVMILPTIYSMTVDTLKSVPRHYRESALAIGATRWQMIYKMVIGNAALMPHSLTTPASTLTSVLTMGIGNTVMGSLQNDTYNVKRDLHWDCHVGKTVLHVILPAAVPSIVTGVVLSAGRVFGEAAALIYTAGQSAPALNFGDWNPFNISSPLNPMRPAETLAVHIWEINSEGIMPDVNAVSAGASAVLIIVVLLFNFSARKLGTKLYKETN